MSEQEKEITQPIVLNGSAAPQSADEGTQPLVAASDEPQSPLPDWLLKFASNPEQAVDEKPLMEETDLLSSYSDDFEEDEAFTPPQQLPEEYEWQELSEFQEHETLDIEPAGALHEIPVELGATEVPEDNPEPTPSEVAETIIPVDPQVEAAESFKQEVGHLLKKGQRKEALAMIRENKSDPLMAEAAKKTLRSQLTLSSDAGDFWNIYDELNSSSL